MVNIVRSDEDRFEYAVCVNEGNPKVSCFQWAMRERKAVEEELWYCSDPYGPRGPHWYRYWLEGGPTEFSEYCVEKKQLGGVSFTGQLTYQGELPVCTFPSIDQAIADYYHPSLENDTVCTERFFYDNGGCLPYDVRGAEPPYEEVVPNKALGTLPFHQLGLYLSGLLTDILSLIIL